MARRGRRNHGFAASAGAGDTTTGATSVSESATGATGGSAS